VPKKVHTLEKVKKRHYDKAAMVRTLGRKKNEIIDAEKNGFALLHVNPITKDAIYTIETCMMRCSQFDLNKNTPDGF